MSTDFDVILPRCVWKPLDGFKYNKFGPKRLPTTMSTSPSFLSVVPNSNPFADSVFDGTALELDVQDSVTELPVGTIDWVSVELRTNTAPSSAVCPRC